MELRDSFGTIPDQFVTYFTSRFPLLLLHVYLAMEFCREEDIFDVHYANDFEFAGSRYDAILAPTSGWT